MCGTKPKISPSKVTLKDRERLILFIIYASDEPLNRDEVKTTVDRVALRYSIASWYGHDTIDTIITKLSNLGLVTYNVETDEYVCNDWGVIARDTFEVDRDFAATVRACLPKMPVLYKNILIPDIENMINTPPSWLTRLGERLLNRGVRRE